MNFFKKKVSKYRTRDSWESPDNKYIFKYLYEDSTDVGMDGGTIF